MLDFNRECLAASPISILINSLIEKAEPPEENVRQYLGASAIGSECLRRVQFDWLCRSAHPTRVRDIFARGHFHEEVSRQHLVRAGFRFEQQPERLRFSALDGLFRGHADGILTAGPQGFHDLIYPTLWEHKAMNAKNWRAIERDGIAKSFPQYAAQVAIYQAYLNVTNPALVTVVNADTCERLHLIEPFDAERAQHWSDRAVAIVTATRAGEQLARVSESTEDWRCKMCSHRERCWK
jgi:hypothetical protein